LDSFAGDTQENFGHTAAMVRMGRRAAGDHADKVAGRDGVGGRTAQPFAGILTFDAAFGQRQAAGPHAAIFTAGTLRADIALLHVFRPIEHRIDAQPTLILYQCRISHLSIPCIPLFD
jgi:hypothetical protein